MAAKTAPTDPKVLKVGTPVIARLDMRNVPEGTAGKVTIVNGLTWLRYWVSFENGAREGLIDRSKLATADEWARRFDAPAAAVVAVAGTGEAVAAATDGGSGTASKYGVPELLIERSRSARGFRRTRMSPVFCAVAKRPSSDPVRLE